YYYAGPNGVLVTGKYYAWRLNENCDITTGWYYFDSTGKLVDSGIVDGYYYVDGKPTEMGLFEYEGNYYVAQYDGKIIKAQEYYVWKIDDSAKDAFAEGWYEFDENGVIIPLKNGIIDGYYYVDGKPTEMGLFKYADGNYYVAQYDGKIITSENYTTYGAGKYYVWKVDESASEIATGWYYFGADGAMLQGICEHPEKGGLYYFENGKVKEMGLFEYEGNYYVAQYDGKIITSENYTNYGAGKYYVWKIHESASEIKAGWYFFDAEGKMITE
ncbi:MAG: hypothetical protein J6B86_04185, partial [Clostridia bacterium]|nr:hypothetical protein [Clostridia bacterium]